MKNTGTGNGTFEVEFIPLPPLISVPNVHPTIKHDGLAPHGDHHTAAANVLPSPQGEDLDLRRT